MTTITNLFLCAAFVLTALDQIMLTQSSDEAFFSEREQFKIIS